MFEERNNALVAELKFKDFVTAFAFMTLVAELARRDAVGSRQRAHAQGRVRVSHGRDERGRQVQQLVSEGARGHRPAQFAVAEHGTGPRHHRPDAEDESGREEAQVSQESTPPRACHLA